MESRVLSRANAFATVSHLPKPSRESHHNVCFVSVKPIGAVGEGGNVIWGRQLRPALLLESSPAPVGLFVGRRENLQTSIVAATAASSSGEGSDSPGERSHGRRSGRVLREVTSSCHRVLLLVVVLLERHI